MASTKEALIKLRVQQQLKDELEAIAEEEGEAMSVIVRQALNEFLAARRKEAEEEPPKPPRKRKPKE